MKSRKPSERQNRKVLVIDKARNTRACLGVLRSLGRHGLVVHLAIPEQEKAGGPVLASRYLARFHHLPAYEDDPDQWLAQLLELVRREDFQAVFPVTDSSVIPIQENAHKLGELADRFALLNDTAYRITYNKQLTRELALAHNIPVAEGAITDCADDVTKFADKHGFPVVLKPLSSFTEHNLTDRQRVQTLHDAAGVEAAFADGRQTFVMEKFFHGVGCGVAFLAKNGQVLYSFQHERVHEPMEGGGSTYRRSVMLHEDLLAASRTLVEALDYTGVGLIEFRLDPHTDKFILVEVNGRFWGSLPLAIAAGADFPAWLYSMMWQERTDFCADYRTPYFGRNLFLDTNWFLRNLTADKSDPTLNTRPLWSILAESRNLILGRESWDTWARDDPRPFFAEFNQFFGK